MTWKLYTWPLAMLAAAVLALTPYGCDTQPAAVKAVQQAAEARQDATEAAYQAVYGDISDAERLRGDAEVQP